jgi:hypothetical protein
LRRFGNNIEPMQHLARRLLWPALAASFQGLVAAEKVKDLGNDIAYIREELGVNSFTAPSIGVLFEELQALQPIPFEQAWRDLPDGTPGDRPRLALCAGQVIADGFLVVAVEKQSRIEPVGRVLLKLAKGLGIADHVTRHNKSFLELAARGRWAEVKRELIRAQADVEAGMMALKDEEIAHLVSLGGWLRGLEITSTVVLDDFRPEKSRRLIQPAVLDYFIDRLSTLEPKLKETHLVGTIERNLAAIRKLTAKPGDALLTQREVQQIRDLAREANKAIAVPSE